MEGRILELEGMYLTVQQILDTVRQERYDAASRAVRQIVEAIRRDRRNITYYSEPLFLSRRTALGHLWKWDMGAPLERREIADFLLVLSPLFCFVHSFRETLRHRDGEGFLALLLAELKYKIGSRLGSSDNYKGSRSASECL